MLALTLVRTNLTRVTSKLKSKTVPVLPPLIFTFHLLPSLVHPTRFCLFLSWLPCHFYLVIEQQQFKPVRKELVSNVRHTSVIMGAQLKVSNLPRYHSDVMFQGGGGFRGL